jgi:hypothetical protein
MSALGVGVRHHIALDWGNMYSSAESFDVVQEAELKVVLANSLNGSSPPLSREQVLQHMLSAAMTTMVLSNDFIRLVGDLVRVHSTSWSVKHYEMYFNALETSHWHAFSFNANIPLRIKLQQKGFMNENRSTTNLSASLPHLMEQEIMAAEHLLRRAYCLYQAGCEGKDAAVESFAQKWIER